MNKSDNGATYDKIEASNERFTNYTCVIYIWTRVTVAAHKESKASNERFTQCTCNNKRTSAPVAAHKAQLKPRMNGLLNIRALIYEPVRQYSGTQGK